MTESTIVWYCRQSDRECCAKVFVSSTEISSKGRKYRITLHIITTVCHTAQHELFPLLFIICHVGLIIKKSWANLYGHKNPWQLTWQHEFMFRGTCQRGSLKSQMVNGNQCLWRLFDAVWLISTWISYPFHSQRVKGLTSQVSSLLGRIRGIHESDRSICLTKNSAPWDPGSFLIHNARDLAGVLSGTFVCALIEKHKVISRCWK